MRILTNAPSSRLPSQHESLSTPAVHARQSPPKVPRRHRTDLSQRVRLVESDRPRIVSMVAGTRRRPAATTTTTKRRGTLPGWPAQFLDVGLYAAYGVDELCPRILAGVVLKPSECR